VDVLVNALALVDVDDPRRSERVDERERERVDERVQRRQLLTERYFV
jgi:hypothetical protein